MKIKMQRTALQCIKSLKPYTLAGFEHTVFCSIGGDDDHIDNYLNLIVLFFGSYP
jgi:hypothetical protein